MTRFEIWGGLTSLAVLSACAAPQRLDEEPHPAPRVARVWHADVQPPVVAIVAFTTSIAPGKTLGGNFDDDGSFRVQGSENHMFVWEHEHECILSDAVLSILEQEAGLVAHPSPECWADAGEPEAADALLSGTLEDLTLNSFADPGRVDVEVMVAWQLFDRGGESIFRKSTYGFTSMEIEPAVMFGGAVGLAVAESLRRVLADEDLAEALRAAR